MTAATTLARALALGAVRLGADAALARIDGPDAASARDLVGSWRADSAAVTAAAQILALPRPLGWQRIHPSWIEHALAGESPAVHAAVIGEGDRPLDRYLARWFLGGMVAMVAEPLDGPSALVGLEPAVLTQVLTTLGRRQLAHALGGSAAREIAAFAIRVPWGRALIADVAAVARLGDAATAELGRRRSAMTRTAGLDWTDPLALFRVGLRAIAPTCAGHGDLPGQLVQRLPRPIGQVAALELMGVFAAEPPDGVSAAEVALAIARDTVAP